MKRLKRVNPVNYLYIMPILILITVFFIYPIIQVVIASFTDIRLGQRAGEFVGLYNYRLIFSDPVFWRSARTTLIWTFANTFFQLIPALWIALLLNQKLKGIHFFRSIMLFPWIVPMSAIAVSMRWMLLPGVGIFNEILKNTIGTQINFLGSRNIAIPTLMILDIWKLMPFGVLLLFSALQTIPEELYDAARVDGANFWKQTFYITMPLIARLLWFMPFLIFVWKFNVFDAIWLTTQGGPGHVLQTFPILVYRRAFLVFRLGEGAAIATIGAIFLIIVSVLYFKYMTPKD